ncbi:MAG: Hpt domain-containing protein, partial [Methylobacter sp.]
MIPDEYLRTFVVECSELLDQMEQALLDVEQAEQDPDIINAIFRAAHTIKGSAGMFGIDHIVAFTHAAESVLDRVRSGEIAMTPVLAALFIDAHDHLRELVREIAEQSEPDPETERHGQQLVAQLQASLCAGPADAAEPDTHDAAAAVPAVPEAPVEREQTGATAGTDLWHISLRFGPDVFRNGMDPFSFVRCLNKLGSVIELVTVIDTLPSAAQLDPETCYLGFEISYRSDADKADIEAVFNFVRGDCFIRILPPHSKISEYQRLIEELPEQEMRLGEILIACGTLTADELDAILHWQARHGSDQSAPLIGEVLVEQHLVSPPVVEAALEKQQRVKDGKKSEANLIRVDADKLDNLINLI